MAMRVPGGVKANTPDDPFDVRSRDLRLGEPHDVPTGEKRLQIFLGVGDEPGGAIVASATFDENAALDLDQRPAFDVGEIGPPFPFCMEHELTFQLRATEAAPVEGELCFEAGTASGCSMADARHGLRRASKGQGGKCVALA